MARKSKGRQKVEMVKMKKETNLQVTFSKRRLGLFKKASELCTLCGAEVAIIVFSPGKKVFSFGHPSVEGLVDPFICGNAPPSPVSGTMQLIEAHLNASTMELNLQLTTVMNQLEIAKKRGEEISQMRKVSQSQYWWESPAQELSLPQLEQLNSLEELRKNVEKQAEKLLMMHNSNPPPPTPLPPPPHFFDPSASSSSGPRVAAAAPGVFNPFERRMMMPPTHPHGYYLGYQHVFPIDTVPLSEY